MSSVGGGEPHGPWDDQEGHGQQAAGTGVAAPPPVPPSSVSTITLRVEAVLLSQCFPDNSLRFYKLQNSQREGRD